MKKIRLILIAVLLTITAFAGGLVVSASLNAPNSATAAIDQSSLASTVNQDANSLDAASSNADVNSATDTDTNISNIDAAGVATQSQDSAAPGAPTMMNRMGPPTFFSGPQVEGIISSTDNSGNTLVLRDRRTVTLNAQTVVGDANGTLSASSLKAGDLIFALGQVQTDKSLLARWVLRLPPPPVPAHPISGKVSAVNVAGNSFQFSVGISNTTWSATISSTTKILKAGKVVSLSDIAVGDQVTVIGKADQVAHTIAATVVQDGQFRPGPMPGNFVTGNVGSIDTNNNSFVVSPTIVARPADVGPGPGQKPGLPTRASATPVTVIVDSSTHFNGQNLTKLSDLKVGDHVVVIGDKQSDGSFKAKSVTRMPNFPMPGGPQSGGGSGGGSANGNKGAMPPNPNNQSSDGSLVAPFDPNNSLNDDGSNA
jgi:hypothetical protein